MSTDRSLRIDGSPPHDVRGRTFGGPSALRDRPRGEAQLESARNAHADLLRKRNEVTAEQYQMQEKIKRVQAESKQVTDAFVHERDDALESPAKRRAARGRPRGERRRGAAAAQARLHPGLREP